MPENRIERVGFVLRPNSPNILPLYEDIKAKFESRGMEVLLGDISASMVGIDGINFNKMCQEVDLLVFAWGGWNSPLT